MGIYEEEWIMDSSASRSSEDDTTKSGGGKAESGGDKIGGQGQPPFIGYDAEYDRTIRESAKQDLIESDALQNVLFKIYRGSSTSSSPAGRSHPQGLRNPRLMTTRSMTARPMPKGVAPRRPTAKRTARRFATTKM